MSISTIYNPSIFEPAQIKLSFCEKSNEIKEKTIQLAQSSLEAIGKTITPTNALLGICLTTHAISLLYPTVGESWIEKGCFSLPLIMNGEVWRLATSQILHANLIHLGLNMHFLYHTGPKIEAEWGSRGFAQLAIMAVAAKVLAISLFSPNTIGIGLSGILWGMEGALLISESRKGKSEIQSAILYHGITEWLTAKAAELVDVPIGHIAHVSGFAGGMLFGLISSTNESQKKTLTEQASPAPQIEELPSADMEVPPHEGPPYTQITSPLPQKQN